MCVLCVRGCGRDCAAVAKHCSERGRAPVDQPRGFWSDQAKFNLPLSFRLPSWDPDPR